MYSNRLFNKKDDAYGLMKKQTTRSQKVRGTIGAPHFYFRAVL
jgi:hypothetical protein